MPLIMVPVPATKLGVASSIVLMVVIIVVGRTVVIVVIMLVVGWVVIVDTIAVVVAFAVDVIVLLSIIAFEMKAASLIFAEGLIVKTMPSTQWFAWAQKKTKYNHISGFLLYTNRADLQISFKDVT